MWKKRLYKFMPRCELTWWLPMLNTRLIQASTIARKNLKRVIWWWLIWDSRFPSIRAKLHNRKYGSFQVARKINENANVLSSIRTIRISLTLSMWLICFNIIQMIRSCTSQTQGWVLCQVRGTDVGWLCGTSKVPSRGHNLGYRCLF